jgi:hypothetical protein
MVLAGLRSLLRRNGLIVISTPIVNTPGYSMEFNNAGRIQEEANTFWYLSTKLFDYLLRYMKLAPIDSLFLPFTEATIKNYNLVFDKPAGYLSVLCRAVDHELPTSEDEWMQKSVRQSWEYRWLTDWKRAKRQPVSRITYRGEIDTRFFREDVNCLNLWEKVNNSEPVGRAGRPSDGHTLLLSDQS